MPQVVDHLIFGGSFDPPHLGHLGILRYILQNRLASCVHLLPAAVSPFKEKEPPSVRGLDRLRMLQKLLAHLYLEGFERKSLSLLDLELKRRAPSYTVDSCRILREKYEQRNEKKIAILIGADSLKGLELWKDIEELLSHHSFWVFLRNSVSKKKLQEIHKAILTLFPQARIEILWDSPLINCASSELRSLLATKPQPKELDCLLPEVWEYIQEKKLYIDTEQR